MRIRMKKILVFLKYNLRKILSLVWWRLKETKRWYSLKRKKICQYPATIQLPITHLCNFDCVMCGMHHMINRPDFSAEQLFEILSDKLFKEVTSVGLNGGEPFLKNDFVECITTMTEVLPKLKVFNIISNGFFTDKILSQLEKIKPICESKGIKVNLSISVDGVNDMQDFHRGHKDAFVNADTTIRKILKDKEKYVDLLNVICTITRYNIYRISEVEAWSKDLKIDVSYNIATYNVRIENEDRLEDFSIFSDEHARMLAQEFFYAKALSKRDEKYFALYLYAKEKKRYSDCSCKYNDWVTLTPDAQIGFCATYSKNLGSSLEKSAYDIVQGNLDYLDEIKANHCKTCSHYMYSLDSAGLKKFHVEKKKMAFMR